MVAFALMGCAGPGSVGSVTSGSTTPAPSTGSTGDTGALRIERVGDCGPATGAALTVVALPATPGEVGSGHDATVDVLDDAVALAAWSASTGASIDATGVDFASQQIVATR